MTLITRDEVLHQALPCGCSFAEGMQVVFCPVHPNGTERPGLILPADVAQTPATVDTQPSKADRPLMVGQAAMLEAGKHYGEKFALAFIIYYKDETGALKVDSGGNVSRSDMVKLFAHGIDVNKQEFNPETDRFVALEHGN